MLDELKDDGWIRAGLWTGAISNKVGCTKLVGLLNASGFLKINLS